MCILTINVPSVASAHKRSSRCAAAPAGSFRKLRKQQPRLLVDFLRFGLEHPAGKFVNRMGHFCVRQAVKQKDQRFGRAAGQPPFQTAIRALGYVKGFGHFLLGKPNCKATVAEQAAKIGSGKGFVLYKKILPAKEVQFQEVYFLFIGNLSKKKSASGLADAF